MNALNLQAIMALTALVSMIGSAIGVYVGMKVGMAKMETWAKIIDVDVKRHESRLAVIGDDVLTHDIEIGDLYRDSDRERVRRQVMR